MQCSQIGLLKGTRDMDAHMSLALPTNCGRATNRLATGPEGCLREATSKGERGSSTLT